MNNNSINKLNPDWVTGFIDAEGCFMINITKRENRKSEWRIQACFQTKLHIREKNLLLQIKSFFNDIGNIYTTNNTAIIYKVGNLNDIIRTIIPHFENYPLITQKQSDFLLFKEIVRLMNKGQHLNKEGIIKIINLKASLNKGLSDKLKIDFPNIIKVERSKVNIPININYNWIAGFMSGDGCFSIGIYKSDIYKTGYRVKLQIIFTQHSRDEVLFNKIKNILGCGFIIKHSKRNAIDLRISKFEDTHKIMIPIFNKYGIKGGKSLDFQDFCLAAELVDKKDHLTLKGLEKIRNINVNMNKGRYVQKEKLLLVK